MFPITRATLLVILIAPACLASIVDDKKAAEPADFAADFASRVLDVAKAIHENYVIEITEGKLVAWAIERVYDKLGGITAEIRFRLRHIEAMQEKELLALLNEVGKQIEKYERDRPLDIALEGMMRHLDEQSWILLDGEGYRCIYPLYRPETIGVELTVDPASGLIRVRTPVRGSPAYMAGIRAGDLILDITILVNGNGSPRDPPRTSSTYGMSVYEAGQWLKGRPGTEIGLTIRRPGLKQPLELKVVRQKFEIENVRGFKRRPDDSWDYWVDPGKKVGYVRLGPFNQINQSLPGELKKIVETLQRHGLRGLVVDLRFNPGGLLTTGVAIGRMFVENGQILTIRGRPCETREVSYATEKKGCFLDFPVVCLINHDTARMSEALAACLQDHKRAVIMGERSKGEGQIGNIVTLNQGVSLRLTTAMFWRPNGKKLHKIEMSERDDNEWGVTPAKDYLLNLSAAETADLADHLEEAEEIRPVGAVTNGNTPRFIDRQLELAVAYLRSQIQSAPVKK